MFVKKFNLEDKEIFVKDEESRTLIESLSNNIENLSQDITKILKTKLTVCENVDDMKKANLSIGDYVLTKAYYSEVGGALYTVIAHRVDTAEAVFIPLNNGLTAQMLCVPSFTNCGIHQDGNESDFNKIVEMLTQDRVIFDGGSYNIYEEIKILHDINILVTKHTLLNAFNDMKSVISFGSTNYEVVKTGVKFSSGVQTIDAPIDKIIQISDTTLFHPSREYYSNGELFLLKQGKEVNIIGCYGANGFVPYTNGTMVAYDTVKCNIKGRGLSINSNNHEVFQAVKIMCCYNSTFENISVLNKGNTPHSAISIELCLDCNFNDIEAIQEPIKTSGFDYGVSVSCSQNLIFNKIVAIGGRHGFSMGGGGLDYNSVNRYITADGIFDTNEIYSVDFHGNCQFCGYTGKILNGVDCSGDQCFVHGEVHTRDNKRAIYLVQPVSLNHDFSNITFYLNSTAVPVIVCEQPDGRLGGTLNVSDCKIIKLGGDTTMYISMTAPVCNGKVTINAQNNNMLYGNLLRVLNITPQESGVIDLINNGGSVGIPDEINGATYVRTFIKSNYTI